MHDSSSSLSVKSVNKTACINTHAVVPSASATTFWVDLPGGSER